MGALLFALLLTLVVSILVGVYAHYSKSKALRHCAVLSLFGQWFMVLFYAGTYYDNGVYEFASFFWCAALSVDFCALFYFTSIIMKPDVPVDWRTSTIINKLWMALFFFGFMACGIAMMVTARNENPLWFNYATGAALIVFGLANSVYFIMILRDAEHIHAQIDKNVHGDKLKKLEYRMSFMRRTLVINLVLGVLLNFPFPILHWIDGSTGDLYLIVSALYTVGFLLIHASLGVYLRWDNHRDKSHLTAISSGQMTAAAAN